MRGTLLMALSNKFGWLVLATGNKSELSVGYSTLYGDMVGGFAPLKDVFKTRVYELARWRNAQPGGAGDPRGDHRQGALAPSCARTSSTRTRCRPTTCSTRSSSATSRATRAATRSWRRASMPRVVDRVIRLTDAAEYKRRQGPLGVKITAQGVRQGPPDAGHEPLRGLRRACAEFIVEIVDARLGALRRGARRSPTRCSTATSACRGAATGTSPRTAASSPSRCAEGGVLLGSARLLPAAGDASRQVRQVAVAPERAWAGVGRALMDALEAIAAAGGRDASCG